MQSTIVRRFKRPFSNAHWLLLAALIVVWELALWAQPCNEPPYYFEIVLVTVTVCISLWLSHLRVAPILTWRGGVKVITGAIYDLTLFFLLWVVVSMPIAVAMPTYQCYTNRAKVSELILSAYTMRSAIERRAAQTQSLNGVGAGLRVELGRRTKGGLVTNDEIIIVASDDPPAVAILQPSFIEGKITWSCLGFPTKHMPGICR